MNTSATYLLLKLFFQGLLIMLLCCSYGITGASAQNKVECQSCDSLMLSVSFDTTTLTSLQTRISRAIVNNDCKSSALKQIKVTFSTGFYGEWVEVYIGNQSVFKEVLSSTSDFDVSWSFFCYNAENMPFPQMRIYYYLGGTKRCITTILRTDYINAVISRGFPGWDIYYTNQPVRLH